MLLTGTHPRSLDDKKRLVLPKRVRDEVGEETRKLLVSPGPDQCLWIFRERELERLTAKLDQVPATDAEARVFRRLFFAQMETVELDKAGRILIPERLLQMAGLEHEVVLIGVHDHLELWEGRRWQEYMAQHGPRFDAVAEAAFRKG